MIERVTTQTQMRAAQRNLQENMTQLARTQEAASTLNAIRRPSDDPTGTATAMQVRSDLRANGQYQRNTANADAWLTTLESSFSATTSLMNRVRDLTVQGANDGSMSATAKEAIAVELVGLRDELLNVANTSYLGRTVFAGNSDAGVAYSVALSDPADFSSPQVYTFTGDATTTVERRTSANSTIRVDADGSAVFGTGDDSVFSLIDSIVTKLRTDESVSSSLTDIDERMGSILTQHTAAGARQTLVDRARLSLSESAATLEGQRSDVEDLDLGQAILDLQLQEVTYQAALAVTARVLQPTLMDFLR
ncbi:flagellar hook-associated protein 3 [Cryobacterium sp. TMS1-20-1]|uniref:flagellin N-terminal helical domain-containing protein n=1 Tax=unclassified Cryobacterium TaxID=2649013 RepID=UPI00106D04AF|nr:MULTISPECIES: flagellar hook-associated protein 3 [unclassified Cryobacterium]TFC75596.1 flagellar hook-associated protein 3 [Cryobacterium sp. TMS1-20-1]TFD51396.1 flagellar hook-associated protein 3 [Cryobacterium sp. Hh11]TFD58601.1 flagellar hook-associated protein 3 [Cryobacterium sp. Hh7]